MVGVPGALGGVVRCVLEGGRGGRLEEFLAFGEAVGGCGEGAVAFGRDYVLADPGPVDEGYDLLGRRADGDVG